MHSPIGDAIAERLRREKQRPREEAAAELDDLRTDMTALRAEVSDLQERLNFAERLLLQAPRGDQPEHEATPTPV